MPIVSTLGWLMVIAAVVVLLTMRHDGIPNGLDDAAKNSEPKNDQMSGWCNVLEGMLVAKVFVFSSDFVVLTSGLASQCGDHSGRHAVDVVPHDAAESVLGAVAAAFRGDAVSMSCPWETGDALLLARRLDERSVVVAISNVKSDDKGGGHAS